jgi:KDO2-lipid IV(A) lauroyltransferase
MMHFRSVKDAIALPLHRFGFLVAGLHPSVGRAIMGTIGAAAKAAYFLPGSHVHRTVANFCRATGRSDSWAIYSGMVGNVEQVALHFGTLYRYGRSKLLAQTVIDPTLVTEYQRFGQRGGGFILVPHCVGAVLSSAGLSEFCPTTLLVREPRSEARCQLMTNYLHKLGPKFIPSRHVSPATVMRNIVRSLHGREVVVGTTDTVTPGPDTVETHAFGQPIHSPAWPARIAARCGVPIVPCFIHMERRQLRLLADEAYWETDIQKSTQRWVSSFERRFRQYPSDWVFMFDKHWARVLAAAANRGHVGQAEPVPPSTQASAPEPAGIGGYQETRQPGAAASTNAGG